MRTKNVTSLLLFVVTLWLVGCAASPTPETPTAGPGMLNPASVYCEEQGGKTEIRTQDDGGQYGACIFPDGSECEEWAFFRGECEPQAPDAIGMPNPASVYCEEQGGKTEIRTGDDGGQYGACIFPDGSECEEWAFFRSECKPGE